MQKMENVSHFINFCKKLKVNPTCLFESNDLVENKMSNLRSQSLDFCHAMTHGLILLQLEASIITKYMYLHILFLVRTTKTNISLSSRTSPDFIQKV